MERKRNSLLFLVSFSLALSFLGLAFQAAFDCPRRAIPAPSISQPTDRISENQTVKIESGPQTARPPEPGVRQRGPIEKPESKRTAREEDNPPAGGKQTADQAKATTGERKERSEAPFVVSPPEANQQKPFAGAANHRAPGKTFSVRGLPFPLVARPGEDLRVLPGQAVLLDGTGSSSLGGRRRQVYRWRLLERPRDSATVIDDPESPRTLLVPDRPGLYAVELRSGDGEEGQEGEKELPGYIVITAEGSKAAMPDVTGLALEEARLRLDEAGIVLERISVKVGTGEPDGRVLAQEPQAGAVLPSTVAARLVIALSPWADTDLDGMADAWEYELFGNLEQDASGDADGDGFINLQEFRSGTHAADRREAPVAAANLFEYDRYGRLVYKQITFEP